jgi:hypothetical protein
MRRPTDWIIIRFFAAIPLPVSALIAGVCAVIIALFWVDLMNIASDLVTAFILVCILVHLYRRRRRKRKEYNPKWAKLTLEEWLNIMAAIPTCFVVFAACMCLLVELIASWALGPYFIASFALLALFFSGAALGGATVDRVRKDD